jgi:signal peptidase I
LGGQLSYVITHGNSMEPRFRSGDLAIVHPSSTYDVGEIVAYQSNTLKRLVMHRIVDRDGAAFVFKGDNNNFLDPEHPGQDRLLGRLVVHIPRGGIWLERLTSPVAVAVMLIVVLVGGGNAVQSRRHARRKHAMSGRKAPRIPRASPFGSAPRPLRAAGAIIASTGLLGIGLGAFAFATPTHLQTATEAPATGRITFSYRTAVALTAAYDGTTVTSPDPIFRSVADTVDVTADYRGGSGRFSVSAELSNGSGWHTTVPLVKTLAFTGGRFTTTVRLNLTDLEARGEAAARATGVPAGPLAVAVVPAVHAAGEAPFAPALRLTLSADQLVLDPGQSLTMKDSATVERTKSQPRTLDFAGREMVVSTARDMSTVLTGGSIFLAALLLLVIRGVSPTSEGVAIQRRYGPLLIEVEPMPTPAHRPVVDVTEFATLARLAERYGLLVLHWTRSRIETYLVQDEGTTYRYRTITAHPVEAVIPSPRSPSDPATTELIVPSIVPAAASTLPPESE